MDATLDVGKVVIGAFLIPWWNRKAFARALAIPLALMVGLSLGSHYLLRNVPQLVGWLVLAVWSLLFCVFAVKCHRLVLLDTSKEARVVRPHWSRRETRFLFSMVVVWLLALVIWFVFTTIALNVLGYWSAKIFEDSFRWIAFIASVPSLYLFARLSLVFPATAVDRIVDLKWSWRVTRRNGWRLFIVVAVLPWILSHSVDLLGRQGATALEAVLLTVVGVILFAVEVAALSLSYRELAANGATTA